MHAGGTGEASTNTQALRLVLQGEAISKRVDRLRVRTPQGIGKARKLRATVSPNHLKLRQRGDEAPPSNQRDKQRLAVRNLVCPGDVIERESTLAVALAIDLLAQRVRLFARAQFELPYPFECDHLVNHR